MNSFNKIVLDAFIDSVDKFKDRNALCINEIFFTYKELGACVAKIRSATGKLDGNDIVGLVINDDIDTYASIFALWLDGKAYVALHPKQPVERCLEICEQANIEVILDSGDNTRYTGKHVIHTELLSDNEPVSLKPELISDDALAYILFTSGSTGKPKGVKISRKNVAAFIDSFFATPVCIDETDRCLQSFDLTFDVSVQCYLTALTRGACVYTIPHDEIKWSYVFGLLEDHQLTRITLPPSMVNYLRPYFDEICIPSVKSCILTAEAVSLDLVDAWSPCIPNAEIYDFYGPTECTIYCTYSSYHHNGMTKTLNGMFTIGKPLQGITAIIIDEAGSEVAEGEKGELCVAGDLLTPGYWKNPEKNAEAFFEKEHDGQMKRFYHTGDLCYIDKDGDIMISGRLDYQAKIQGYRVEMGEIEHYARSFMNNKNAIALPFQNKVGITEIALFIENDEVDSTPLAEYLKTKLPHYMIPSVFYYITKFPLNSNEKIDRVKLKQLIK